MCLWRTRRCVKVDAASRRVQFTHSGDVFHAAGRRVYLKVLFWEQKLNRAQIFLVGR